MINRECLKNSSLQIMRKTSLAGKIWFKYLSYRTIVVSCTNKQYLDLAFVSNKWERWAIPELSDSLYWFRNMKRAACSCMQSGRWYTADSQLQTRAVQSHAIRQVIYSRLAATDACCAVACNQVGDIQQTRC